MSNLEFSEDKLHEECAIVGVIGEPEAAKYCYLSLYAMQHRGQEGSGIVSSDGEAIYQYRDMGLVADIFDARSLSDLRGNMAVGHNRYATCGSKDWQNLQPLVANLADNCVAIAHNGNLVNADEIRVALEASGAIFSATSDTAVILHLIARETRESSIVAKTLSAVKSLRGAYSLVVMTYDRLIAVRDPAGVRPLSVGRFVSSNSPPDSKTGAEKYAYIVASETCAFDLVGAEFIRDIAPGEVLEINNRGEMTSYRIESDIKPNFCVFEYVYFARPDSKIDGRSVYQVRKRLGQELAREHPAQADLVIPVPDSGVPAALGYAQQIGLPLEMGLIRNHYVGRTFIEPQQSIRDFGVKVKLNPTSDILQGKRVVVVDDSIVRGTTCRKIVKMLRQAGAKELHFRISSPPTMGSCYYGIDTPSPSELIAANNTLEQIRDFIGADSLGYLSNEGMFRAVQGERTNFCDACFSKDYRLGTPTLCAVKRGTVTSNSPKQR